MFLKWHRLHLSDQSLPPLLFQYTWTRQGYDIYITDLTYIWSERLSQKQIIKRAEEISTTIDPGEDLEQLDVLLEKIGEALQKGKDSTVLSSGRQTDSLEIATNTKLPAPLKPLQWILKLSKESPSYLTDKLLFPLLKEETKREDRQRSLLRQIKQKDYVLSKLFDKIETIGVDLGSVFPSAAGSRKSHKSITRSEAAKFIKGIEHFDEKSWLAKTESSEGGLASNLNQEISDSGDLRDLSFKQPQDGWWREVTKRPESSAKEPSPVREETPSNDKKHDKQAPLKYTELDGEATASSDDDDEFQRLETPPRLRSELAKRKSPPKPKPKPKIPSSSPVPLPLEPEPEPGPEDEATASDTDSELEPEPRQNRVPTTSKSPEPPTPPPQEAPKRPKGGLGTIGGKKKTKEPPVPPAETHTPSKPQGSPKSPEIEGTHNINSVSAPTPASPAPAIKPKRLGKLGMIGGKSKIKAEDKARDPVEEDTPPSSSETVAYPDQGSPPKNTQVPKKAKEESPLPVRKMEKVASVPAPEPETEHQRADRRREELKRTLEAKSKAPAKKKRRF